MTNVRLLWLITACILAPSLAIAFTLRSLVMPGPVAEGHAHIEEKCESCHEDSDKETQGDLCLACHTDVRADIAATVGFHGRDPQARSARCYTCHDEHEGRSSDLVELNVAAFVHANTDFPLHDAHAQADCAACHRAGTEYRDTPRQCVGCHADDDVHLDGRSPTCEGCHTPTAWSRTSFDHGAAFPLLGKHAALTCSSCHQGSTFAGAPTTCASCHASDDIHGGRNGAACSSCHSPVAWPTLQFNHLTRTGFALRGSHASLRCESCHVGSLTAALPSTCEGCHFGDDAHQGALGRACGDCHGVARWGQTSFDHSQVSGFALAGAHSDLQCTSCHSAGATAQLGRDCATCHADDPHRGQLGADCDSCHSQLAWSAPRFDHDLVSFALLGKHRDVRCESCHASVAFHDAGSTCADCHSADDSHAGTFGAMCSTCHNPNSWLAWSFDHGAHTGFDLTGAHADATCASCHGERTITAAGRTSCGQCHSRDDPHDGRFGADCGECHGSNSFGELRRR